MAKQDWERRPVPGDVFLWTSDGSICVLASDMDINKLTLCSLVDTQENKETVSYRDWSNEPDKMLDEIENNCEFLFNLQEMYERSHNG